MVFRALDYHLPPLLALANTTADDGSFISRCKGKPTSSQQKLLNAQNKKNTLTIYYRQKKNSKKKKKRNAKLLQAEDGAKHVVHLAEELDRMVVALVVGARWRLWLLLLPPPQLEELLHYL